MPSPTTFFGLVIRTRAATSSEYQLSGLITCPLCGHKYVGTAANSKARRYRYYTCFSRICYGRAGCTASRINADHLDQAVVDAMLDFFQRHDLITAAITAEHALRAESGQRDVAERDAINAQITATDNAIDRYLAVFENGTLDEGTCGTRIRDLTAKREQLIYRRDDLARALPDAIDAPTPEGVKRLHQQLTDVFTYGAIGLRKAVLKAHIAEIKIEGDQLIPIFVLPEIQDPGQGLRISGQVVGPAGLEPATEGL